MPGKTFDKHTFAEDVTFEKTHTFSEVVQFSSGVHGVINTTDDSKQPRFNSRNFTQVSGSSEGFQSKPAQSVTSTGSVVGAEISPRVLDDIDCGNVMGLMVTPTLKGTATKTISGDFRGLQVEVTTDDAGTNTIGGDVSAIWIRAAFSANTITGVMAPFHVATAEAQTNSQNWDCLFQLTGKSAGVWNDDPAVELNLPAGTVKGYIKVLVNGAARYIALYEVGNLAD